MTFHQVSPSPPLACSPRLTRVFLRFKTEEGAVVRTCAGRNRSSACGPCTFFFPCLSHLFPPSTTGSRSSISPCSHHKHLLSSQALRGESALGMKSLLTFLDFDSWGARGWFPGTSWVEQNYVHAMKDRLSCTAYTTRVLVILISSAVNPSSLAKLH